MNKNSISVFTLVLMVFLIPICFSKLPVNKASDMYVMNESNNDFGVGLYRQLSKERKGNLFFSPYSLSHGLAMTYAGAMGNTKEEMAKTMRYQLPDECLHPAMMKLRGKLDLGREVGGIELRLANALMLQKKHQLLASFLKVINSYYGAEIGLVDFQGEPENTRARVNEWVSQRTGGKIRDIISPDIIKEDTFLVLVNAVYFKGGWQYPFKPENTRKGIFTLINGSKVSVSFMKRFGRYYYKDNKGLQVIEIPYSGGRLSMLIYLPRKADGLSKLENSITTNDLIIWMPDKRMESSWVMVSVPKFKFVSSFRLDNALKAMGMVNAFSPTTADFSGFNGRRKHIFLRTVLHKASINVDEKGTEATASTVTEPGGGHEFIADHPFIFLIRDNETGSILFMGRVMDPRK